MSELKQSEDLKLKLIKLVSVDGCSVASAARQLNISTRTAQEFYAGDNQWSKLWWENYEKELEYYSGFGYDKPKVKPDVKIGFEELPKMELPLRTKENKEIYQKVIVDNSRILLISDLHIPYHHPDALDFLQHLKDKYKPTRVICMGDELDKHSLSFHDSDPDLPSAGDELRNSLPVIAELKKMFPLMDILESNHGSLLYRKAHAFGIPKHYLKSYNDVLGVDDGWEWYYDITVDLPNGNKCYLHHGKSSNVTKTSQTMSMCSAQGHFHETFKIEYWGNPVALYWAMQTGCLIDDKSYAFNYNNVNLKRPIIGTGLIINSMPILEPMLLDSEGRWIDRK